MSPLTSSMTRVMRGGLVRTLDGLFASRDLAAWQGAPVRVSFGRDAGHVFVWSANGRRILARAYRVRVTAAAAPPAIHADAHLELWGRFFTRYRLYERGLSFEVFVAEPQLWRERLRSADQLNGHRGLLWPQQRVAERISRQTHKARRARRRMGAMA